MSDRPEVSVVVPVFNEVENIDALVSQLTDALEGTGRPYEIICIDDGSTDGSLQALVEAREKNPRIVVVEFRRNFGQTPAFTAGFDLAEGQWVITIDADLQNDPADIPAMLVRAEEGYDIVSGWRKKRKDAFIMRKIPSKAANWLIGRVTGVALHDYGCSLKVYHRDVVKNINLYGELHRFVPAVAGSMGIRYTEMEVNHRARVAGQSKYAGLYKTLKRTTVVFLDLLTVRFLLTFATRPLHIFGVLGLLTTMGGIALGIYLSYLKLFRDEALANRPLLGLAVLMMVVGVQFISLGLVGEIVVRTYHESQDKPIYAIRNIFREPSWSAPTDEKALKEASG